jgi:hypothetical protein
MDYWHAVAMLRLDRPLGLAELEALFLAGKPAEGLVGAYKGRLLATTVGYALDGVFEGLGRLWMPWRGKEFSRQAAEGVNLFTTGGRRMIRAAFPRYRGLADTEEGASAFAFETSIGPSATRPDRTVLRIDYRHLAENPGFPVRRVLDELVQVQPGLYVGQALMTWGGGPRRVAWFSLEPELTG